MGANELVHRNKKPTITVNFYFSIGSSTGDAANPNDFQGLKGKVKTPLLVGSGVTKENIDNYFEYIDAAIIGSHFKKQGHWSNDLCEKTIEAFMLKVNELRKNEYVSYN